MSVIEKRVGKFTTLVDAETIERFGSMHWHGEQRRSGPYIFCRAYPDRRQMRLHRLIVNAPDGVMVDHINRNTLDNRSENLRICTNRENQANRRKQTPACSSIYKGVHWSKGRRKFVAGIVVDGCRVFLGAFDNELEAAKTYDAAALDAFGQFACTNFDLGLRLPNSPPVIAIGGGFSGAN